MYRFALAGTSKRTRHDYTAEELRFLVAEHAHCPYPDRDRRKWIADQLGVSETSVLYWFQNRRRSDRNKGISTKLRNNRRTPYDRPSVASTGWGESTTPWKTGWCETLQSDFTDVSLVQPTYFEYSCGSTNYWTPGETAYWNNQHVDYSGGYNWPVWCPQYPGCFQQPFPTAMDAAGGSNFQEWNQQNYGAFS